MRIAVSADERVPLVDEVLDDLKSRGHDVDYFGPDRGDESVDWPDVTLDAVRQVTSGRADEAVVMCWTGTGSSIVANKVPGIRAALCHDAETARGARIWNHANVLVLSLRATSGPIVKEIFDRWFDTAFSDDEWNLRQVARLREIEKDVGRAG